MKMLGEFKEKELPVDFICRYLGKSRQEIEMHLETLEKEGAIRREGELISGIFIV